MIAPLTVLDDNVGNMKVMFVALSKRIYGDHIMALLWFS